MIKTNITCPHCNKELGIAFGVRVTTPKFRKVKRLSPEGRRRIAAGQRKRWEKARGDSHLCSNSIGNGSKRLYCAHDAGHEEGAIPCSFTRKPGSFEFSTDESEGEKT